MPIIEIKMPKEITTIEQFNEWCNSLNTDRQDFEIVMKRRPNFHPFNFTEHKNKIHYLIDDGVASGFSRISNFNKIFTFRIRKYDW
jgi:hypothetical protein